MASAGILRSPAERSENAVVLQELRLEMAPESLGGRRIGVRRAYDTDVLFAERVMSENLTKLYARHKMRWSMAGFIESFETDDSIENFVLMFGGERVGLLRVQVAEGGVWIRDVVVTQKYWNRGVGSAAVRFALDFAARQGENMVKVKTFADDMAIRMYVAAGFHQIATDGKHTWLERFASAL